ncbi:membrane lipoprotein lipid attachment site-containing protein [Marinobacter bryozoorum]|uniref:membrane lipoprotein lipid attachment site-containing protein n=1 Tax=Marinobacter bryozoorum TaxID=256324 RepID=UPI002003E146|nr:membrane lipoprotein lipid attachment site-containing protein [Marinobacter bryozoorum]MCK7543275.1 membrane lipoprotein lipid attachment site-containing protein [Marinobacter bryozoorum]
MKKLFIAVLAALTLAGCEGRTIWNPNGSLDEATKDREVWDDKGMMDEATRDREIWDSNGKIDTRDRKIWNDREGKPVIQ